MLSATCHCGKVRVTVPRRPRTLTNCNCSICRRLGALWAYYRVGEVQVEAEPEDVDRYVWGERTLDFVRCRTCGCVTHFESLDPQRLPRMAVNARLFDPDRLGAVRIRRLDGASSWRYLD